MNYQNKHNRNNQQDNCVSSISSIVIATGIGIIAYLTYKNRERITESIHLDSIKNLPHKAMDAVEPFIRGTKKSGENIQDLAFKTKADIKQDLKDTFDDLKGRLREKIETLPEELHDEYKEQLNRLESDYDKLYANLKDNSQNLSDNLK